MTKRRRTLRRVLTMEPCGQTSRGNPERWRSLLACGHFVFRYHSPRLYVHGIMFMNSPEPPFETRAQCPGCAAGEEPDWGELRLSDLDTMGKHGDRKAFQALLDNWSGLGLNVEHYRKRYVV